jgi:hypothetical protein
MFFILAASHLRAASAAKGGNESVFRIGSFDRSSGEFAQGNPKVEVNFVVSQSNPAKDWFAVQPAVLGSADKSQKSNVAAAPRTITFSLQNSPAAAYRLHIALLIENASAPVLKVNINGKTGMFYLHPKLDNSSGDEWDSFDPSYSSADVEFTFPGSYLRRGDNTIALQPVEEAEEAVPDAGINYDAVELAGADSKPESRLESTQIAPTIFFEQNGGELKEEVDAFFRYGNRMAPGGSAEMTVAGKRYHCDLRGGHDFGEEKVQFLVSEFAPQTDARLTLKINGRQENYKQSIDPMKKWTLYVVPEVHLDIGYTDYQAKVGAIHSRTIDEAMKLTADHPDFRFSLDGAWDLQQFLATRSDAQVQRAIEAIQKKQLFVPAQYANLLTGLPTAETLIRSLYPSANFSRKYGTPLDYANITDVPSYSWSYASILASAGIHYFAAASNNYRAPVLLRGHLNENSPVWWTGPDNKRVLLWYSRHYMQMHMLFGMPPLVPAGRDTLPLFLQMYDRPNYNGNSTILYGTQTENSDLFPRQAELAQRWNSIYVYPHLQYAGFHEALQAMEKQSGDSIPTIHGDGGPYWEDGAAADALYLSMERRNEARAQTAEKLATLVSFVNPILKANTAELSQMWTDMVLMDEHTADSYNSVWDPASSEAVDQLALKDHLAVDAKAQVDFITKRSMANLADVIPADTGSVIVFNSLNWKRSGTVSLDLDKGVELVDAVTNQPVPFEVLDSGNGFNRVRFQAQDVPAMGFKVYGTPRARKDTEAQKSGQGTTLESPYYKVQLDAETGAVRSIYDKQLERELVSQESPYRFGEYLYVTGGDKAPNTILRFDHVSPKPALEVHVAGKGKILSVMQTPSGQVAHMESQALNTPSIKTEIRLFDNEKKIELVEDVEKTEVLSKEAVYFSFPFDMKRPQFQYEIQNGVVDPAKDMYPGAGHEWFTAQHWVSVEQGGVSATVMPLDAPLITLGDINRGAWPEEFGKRPGTVFSYAMNNYWDTNYRAGQGGHFSFHYVITSAGATNAADLSRVGWEEITPLESDIITTQDKALGVPAAIQANSSTQAPNGAAERNPSNGLDGKQGSFLDVQDPNIMLQTWKPAEDGNGSILRFVDLGGAERAVTVRTPFVHLAQVWQTDAVERGQTALPVEGHNQFRFNIQPHEIVTVRVVEANK